MSSLVLRLGLLGVIALAVSTHPPYRFMIFPTNLGMNLSVSVIT